MTDGVVLNTIKSADEVGISFFQQELDSLGIPEGAKIALKTLAKFITVLTSTKFGKVEKIKSAQNCNHIGSSQNMARTKLVSRSNYFQRREQFLFSQRPIRNKNIVNRRVGDRIIKIK